MKKLFIIAVSVILFSGCHGCKSNTENPKDKDNAYPLTNQVQHIDGTNVEAPKW